MSLTVDKFVRKTLELLDKERDAEIEETKVLTEKLPAKELQRRGVCLLKLRIASRKTGLYGRIVATFETNHDSLPSHSITPGDITGLKLSHGDNQADELASGIVTKVTQKTVCVAFDDSQDLFSLDEDAAYKLTKLANDVTYKRLKRTLEELDRTSSRPSTLLTSVLFGEQELSPPSELRDIDFVNSNLDASQREAVGFALSQREIAVVHGPPGTGKTTTVIEIILQAVRQGNKILACAPSNIAVDNLVERLVSSKHKVVRLGHPARLLSHIQKYSLDAILSTSDETKLVEDVRKDLDSTLVNLRRAKNRGEKQKLREDMKYLRKELRTRADAATKDILKRADVVLVTLTSATDDGPLKLLDERHFDLVVIDECSQALEAACWIPLVRTGKCVLAGDHFQLPPTILSKEAAAEGLELTLMERVLELYGDKVMKMLTTQYRMNEKIMQWSSDQLYQSRLQAHVSVQSHCLSGISGVERTDETDNPLLLIDTAGCDLNELDLPEEISKGNEGEADIVAAHVERLVECGLKQEDIGVITPYNLQVELIRIRLAQRYPKVEVKSVDGFQGREKEAIIISLVRSNSKGEVGFLAEKRRINVAVTRARRHLAVIGDSETVSHNDFLKSLIDYLTNTGEVQTAQQYIQEGKVHQSTAARPEHVNDLISLGKTGPDKGARPKASKGNAKQSKKASVKKETSDVKSSSSARPKEHMKEDSVEKVEEYRAVLEEFVSDPTSDTMQFPTSLNSHDRLVIHELSEKLGLVHISKGMDSERYIVVSKPSAASKRSVESELPSSDVSQPQVKKQDFVGDNKRGKKHANKKKDLNNTSVSNAAVDADLQPGPSSDAVTPAMESKSESKATNMTEKSDKAANASMLVCQHCGKNVIKANLPLHEIHCARREKSKSAGASAKRDQPAVSRSAKPRQMDKEMAKKINSVDKDDIDALIETVNKIDNFCCFKKCKRSVQTLCNLCQFCQGRYCLEHHIPEVHGCGDAARAEARARISKDGVLYRGSGVPHKTSNDTKKAHLHKRLDHKLTEMASKRKTKPKK